MGPMERPEPSYLVAASPLDERRHRPSCPDNRRSIFHREKRIVFGRRCDRWDCTSGCAHRKRKKLAQRAASLNPDGMLTTTISDRWSDGLNASSADAMAFLQQRERVFRHHIVRAIGKFAYLWVYETGGQHGRVHRHYLVRWKDRALLHGHRRGRLPKWILQKMQAFAKNARLGRIDWQPIYNAQGAGSYVAKYITKTIGDAAHQFPKGFRRFASNDPYKHAKASGWMFSKWPVDVIRRTLEHQYLPWPLQEPFVSHHERLFWLLAEAYLPHKSN